MKKSIILAIIISIFGSTTVFAQNEPCSQDGWIQDTDPKGTNIRNAPGLHGKIIRVIPFSNDPSTDVMVNIVGYSNGWLKINMAYNVDDTFTFDDIGWVSAKKISASIQRTPGRAAPLYALPKRSSKKIGWVPNESDFQIVGFDCFGLKITYKKLTGWISSEDICGNVLTTCS